MEDDRARSEDSAFSLTASDERHSLINSSSGLCQGTDWYQDKKASSVNGSLRLHCAASGVQVTYSRFAAVQLP